MAVPPPHFPEFFFILKKFHFRARWGTEPYVALHFARSFSSSDSPLYPLPEYTTFPGLRPQGRVKGQVGADRPEG